ncbi:tyrosine-type recombinase/integrase [Brachybacterium hainanense]|uniref:Tyrosine-type recombinase/integrase n=1 Tax=Brachybacterium hainanense TaxID=1541174 RepID=A0ABV6R935_9MICO
MASISRRARKDGTTAWRVAYRDPGNPTPTSATFDTHEAADRFATMVDRLGGPAARRQLARLEDGSDGHTLAEVLEDYAARHRKLTPGTVDEYRRILTRSGLAEALGGIPVDLIVDDDVEAWVSARAGTISEETGDRIAPKTIKNEHGLLSTLLGHAVTRGWARSNPARGIELPEIELADPLVLTREQYEAIHQAMDPDYQALVQVLGSTGIRWGEATALQWRDITPGTPPQMVVRRAWKRGQKGAWRVEGLPKSKRSRRKFSIPQKLVDTLPDRGAPGALVFPNREGGAIAHSNFHQRKWVRACEAAGVTDPRPRIHDLRHYFASVMLAAGVPIHVVSERMGHDDISTTVKLYAFLTPEAQAAGLDDMEAMLI